jgi:hypothetical protein
VTVNLALTLDFLNFVTLVSLVGNGSEMLVVVDGSLGVVLVQETILLRLLVVVSRGVGSLLDLLANRLVVTSSGGGSSSGGGRSSSSGRRSGRGSDTSRRVRSRSRRSVGVGSRRSVLVRVVGENLLDLKEEKRRGERQFRIAKRTESREVS